jgi:hypothetical protein
MILFNCQCKQQSIEHESSSSDQSISKKTITITWTAMVGNGEEDWSMANYYIEDNDIGGGELGLKQLKDYLANLPAGTIIKVDYYPILMIHSYEVSENQDIICRGMPPGFHETIEDIAKQHQLI